VRISLTDSREWSRGVPPRRINEIVKRKRAITATARFTRKGKHSWTWFRKLTLTNHGTGAKSKLPEAK